MSQPPTPVLAGGIAAAAAAVIGAALLLGAGGPDPRPDGVAASSSPGPAATATATASDSSDAEPASATGTAAPSGDPTSRPTGPAATSVRPPAAAGPETAPDVVRALCRLEPRRVTELLMGTTGDQRFEALRDAIPELHTRLETLRTAAGGRPGVQPVIAGVTALQGDWQAALQAHDDGDAGRGRTALARTDADMAAVGAALRGPLPDPSVCS